MPNPGLPPGGIVGKLPRNPAEAISEIILLQALWARCSLGGLLLIMIYVDMAQAVSISSKGDQSLKFLSDLSPISHEEIVEKSPVESFPTRTIVATINVFVTNIPQSMEIDAPTPSQTPFSTPSQTPDLCSLQTEISKLSLSNDCQYLPRLLE